MYCVLLSNRYPIWFYELYDSFLFLLLDYYKRDKFINVKCLKSGKRLPIILIAPLAFT
jgi:hypothetical protein